LKSENALTDEQLIARFQKGDHQAYNEIVERYKNRLTNFIYRMSGNIDDTDDIVQDTLVKVYTSKHLYIEIASFSTWIHTIALNFARTKFHKQNKYKTVSLSYELNDEEKQFDITDESATPDIEVNSQLTEEHIQKTLMKIPEVYRELVILRDVQDYSYEEICEMIKLPMGTVKSRINRGREKLKVLLEEFYKEEK